VVGLGWGRCSQSEGMAEGGGCLIGGNWCVGWEMGVGVVVGGGVCWVGGKWCVKCAVTKSGEHNERDLFLVGESEWVGSGGRGGRKRYSSVGGGGVKARHGSFSVLLGEWGGVGGVGVVSGGV